MKRDLAVTVVFFALATIGSPQSGGVPATLLHRMTKGVNITRWFCYQDFKQDQSSHFQTYLNDQDYENFKNLRLDYVRLCVSPDAIYDEGKVNDKCLAMLDQGIKQLHSHNLTVILDLHDNGQMKLDQDGHDNSGFVSFWTSMARHYKGKSRYNLIFEILNEPQFQKNSSVWYSLQKKTVSEIRKVDPQRTIVVTGTQWGGIDTLIKMEPLTEANLLYSFHCYDPFFFTHQGAEWVGEEPGHFKQIPFPSSPTTVASAVEVNDPKFAGSIKWYGDQHFDSKYVDDRLASAVSWGQSHNVPVFLGEFGAYPKVSPPESRASWFAAYRKSIESRHISAAIWGYDDALGLGRSVKDGKVVLDALALKAFYQTP